MIEECNFKIKHKGYPMVHCPFKFVKEVTTRDCDGEEKCIIYMTYFLLNKIDFQTEDPRLKEVKPFQTK